MFCRSRAAHGDPNWTPFAAQSVVAASNVSASATTGRALYSPRFLQHRRYPRRCWPLVNAVGKGLKALGRQLTTIRYRPRNEAGASWQKGSWRQCGPRLGPATSLWPGSQIQVSIVDPRRRDAERRGSRTQTCREFTIDPCRDQVSSRVSSLERHPHIFASCRVRYCKHTKLRCYCLVYC